MNKCSERRKGKKKEKEEEKPKSIFQKYRLLDKPRAYCFNCRLLRSFSSRHTCLNGVKINLSTSKEYDTKTTSSNDQVNFSSQHNNDESHISSLLIFDSLTWEKIATLPASLMKDVPFNFRLAMNESWC
jgi:hypothetical protein